MRTYLAGKKRILPRSLVVAEVVAAVPQPHKLRRTDVRHLRRVPVAFHTFACKRQDGQDRESSLVSVFTIEISTDRKNIFGG